MKYYYVLSGAPGSGKSSVLKELRKDSFICVDEPARQILAEQRSFKGNALPEDNGALFTELLLSRALFLYKSHLNTDTPVIFDRGIPDNLVYGKYFKMELSPILRASQTYRYNPKIFFLPSWKTIYVNDDERKMSFEEAHEFGEELKEVYLSLGYDVIEVPKDTPEKRSAFIQKAIK